MHPRLVTEVTVSPVKPYARQGGHQGRRLEAMAAGFGFTTTQQSAPDAAPCPTRVDEEGANPGGLVPGIKPLRFTCEVGVASKERSPKTPAPTPNHLATRFGHEIGAIADQLRIDTPGTFQRGLDLFRRIVGERQCSRGLGNQRSQPGNFLKRGEAQREVGG